MSDNRGRFPFFFPVAAALLAACVASLPVSAMAQDAAGNAHRQAPAFAGQAQQAFFGDARAAYLHAEGPLLQQMGAVLGIPDMDRHATRTRDLGDGLLLHTGCRQHSCTEKGAVVYDTAAEVVVVAGMIHFNCAPQPAGCAREPTLTVFTSSQRSVPLPALVAIDEWAEDKVPGIARDLRNLP
ncbi:hypothetical protein LDO26_07960 [Luteimonas sp. BDR2-5]|uniref:hypothetical protein n=1 Tax=Proluteimonas luteida TaxID=2878685 RepID=UPI001E627ED8|nr:hypothetical protein [Luteimonas sp. BDR2-5]MCD9028143.1 hypothetical protein [Luteimonas sp. BDR2-5]